jgi:hypothetical protein
VIGPYGYAPPIPCNVPYPGAGPRQSIELPEGFAPPMARFAEFVAAPAAPLPAKAPKPVETEAPSEAPSAEAPSAAGTDDTATGSVPQAKPKPEPTPAPTPAPGTPKIVAEAPTQVASADQPNAATKGTHAVTVQPKSAIPETTSSLSVSLFKGWIPQIGFMLIALSLVGTSLYVSFRRASSTELAAFAGSSLAHVEPEPGDNIAVRPSPRTSPPAQGSGATSQTRSAPRQESPQPKPTMDEWLPKSRADALRMLGAKPDTGTEALKRLVKRLRQTWHPDRANHEDDRRMREIRLKQINVAWDILSGKRAA